MCHVAAGRADAHYSQGIHVWDIAAGYLIVNEAGGVTIDISGRSLTMRVSLWALRCVHGKIKPSHNLY